MNAEERAGFAIGLTRRAGALGMEYYRQLDTITIESKGHHDLVSDADRQVETFVRDEIARHFPQDGILGEEHGQTYGDSDYVWVIDPIDGTANFVRGIPQWCVIVACCRQGVAELGVIHEPVSNETFHARKRGGAFLNGVVMHASSSVSLMDGVIGLDYSHSTNGANVLPLIEGILGNGGAFCRSGSGGLNLAYVASGRLIGYVEEHMNAWDCVAGLLLIEEAGGKILQPNAQKVLQHGTAVVAAGKGVYPELYRICQKPFSLSPC